MKKYVAEAIGTCVLVMFGCGTAMITGCMGAGYLTTAFAFGLSIVAMAYSIGNISGCHINPAVSFAMLVRGKLSLNDFIGYVCAQCAGAFVGTGLLALIWKLGDMKDLTKTYGSNGIGGLDESILAGLLVEIILTFVFILVILGVTSEKFKHGSFAGLVIGLSLTFVHILGIGLTGTSVNPARSFGPALFALFSGETDPIKYLFIFIIGPMVGAFLAAMCYDFLESDS
ncbi:MAG: MIP family channel protein [Ruminococcus sp.]|nr:MIP family channel protein [Ruminococcus sp.]MBQ7069922.1 MIP family channel protein [Ruminococcus sp.]